MATGDQQDGTDQLPEAVVEDILAAERRRTALSILAERDEPVVIDDLAATVLAHERGTEPDAVPRSDRKVARDEFFARHLPKLTATGVVKYDSMVGTLRLADQEQIADHLARYGLL
jgi:hypothetical protein